MNYNNTLAKEATASSNRVAQWSTNLERHGYKWQTIRLRKKSKHSPSVAASNSLPQSVSNDQWFLHDQFRLPPLSVLPQELSFRLDIGEIWEVVPPSLITGQSKCRLETCVFNSYVGNTRYCSWPPTPPSFFSYVSRYGHPDTIYKAASWAKFLFASGQRFSVSLIFPDGRLHYPSIRWQ